LGIIDVSTIIRGELVPHGASRFKRGLDDARLVAAHQRVAAVLSRFRDRCGAANVPVSVEEVFGDPPACIVKQAIRYDLVVLARQTGFHPYNRQDRMLETVLRDTTRPVVTIPQALHPGAGIMVAYRGGREVARTL
jgi:hypothetical protein